MIRHLFPAGLLCALAVAQQFPQTSPRVSRYEMSARLEPGARSITGTQRITWRNTTALPTGEVRLHLYWNAFRDRESTFMREAGPEFRRAWQEDEFGRIDVQELSLVDENGPHPLTVEFVQVDDGNAADHTVVRAMLPSPVPGGGSITLESHFVAVAPKAYRRAGFVPGPGFFCMHWFPKLGVLQEHDGAAIWNCPQFHANTEFFADFSTWSVKLDVPSDYKVGATGGKPTLDATTAGRRVLQFVADDVHDFAWVASPVFVEHVDRFDGFRAEDDPSGMAPAVARFLGVPLASFDLPPVELRLLLQPEHESSEQVRRHFDAAREALRFYGLRYGPWPYPVLTLVDPGSDIDGNGLGGGMEYPTLITCGTKLRLHPRQLVPEGVTIHEFGHQYWYGLSANDEFREAWLDEGINTYSESRAQTLAFAGSVRPVQTSSYGPFTFASRQAATVPTDPLAWIGVAPIDLLPATAIGVARRYGFEGTVLPRSDLLRLLMEQPFLTGFRELPEHPEWSDRTRLCATDNPDPMVGPGWQTISRASYVANSYTRPATLLRTLERMVGRTRWWAFMRGFAAAARFAHPTTEDFVAALAKDCGPEAASFFREASVAGAWLDYAVQSVSPVDGDGPEKSVVIRNFGTLRPDVRVRFRFSGRSQPVWRELAGHEAAPWKEFRFRDSEEPQPLGRLLEVWIDPPEPRDPTKVETVEGDDALCGVLVLDTDLRNNLWQALPDRRPALYVGLRALLQAQARLIFAALLG
ncbi:MAG: M1 family metallopeptidase [Planctomycetota bacterium]